jgi:hypothetical protein
VRTLRTAIFAVVILLGSACADSSTDTSDDSLIDARGAEVMPFDLDATSHGFVKNEAGGVETVLVLDPADEVEIELIRGHLAKEAVAFAAGDFSDPAHVHGMDMPGLDTLSSGATDLVVTYSDLPGGGQITYSSVVPELTDAIHLWFDAQTMDHG